MRKKELLKRSNELNKARISLTATEQDVIYMAMVQFKDDDPIDQKYSIYIPELEKLTGSRPGYSYLKEVTKKLISRVYKIPKENGFFELNILSIAKYKKRTGCIELQFSPEVRDFFFALKENYTSYQFQAALKLKSKYAKRMYEMLCQFKKTGVFNISVRELKERLGLIDLETGKEEYEKFGLFAAYVLNPSKEEINEDTDITFEYKTKKTGRKITHLRFKVYPKETRKNPVIHILEDSTVLSLEKRLISECEMDPDDAKQVIKFLPAIEVENVLNEILKKHKAKEIKSKVGYSTKIFKAWLKGAKPTFEKSEVPRKYKSTKSASQKNEIVVFENEIREKLTNEFEIKYHQVYALLVSYGGDLEKLEELHEALRKLESAIERKVVERNPEAIFEALTMELNGQIDYQPSVVRSGERSNSVNIIGSLLDSSIPEPVTILSEEEQKIRRAKYAIWKDLIGLPIEVKDADKFVEEHSPEDLNDLISIAKEALEKQEIPQEPEAIVQLFKKHLKIA